MFGQGGSPRRQECATMPGKGDAMLEKTQADPARQKAVRDVWERTLSQISTTFGRVAYLASLRNGDSGRYEHFGLAQVYSEDEADSALCESHTEAFRRWLRFSLEQQKNDLEEYLLSLNRQPETVIRAWTKLATYRNLLPAEASEAERELFLRDLELILELLQAEVSPYGSAPAA